MVGPRLHIQRILACIALLLAFSLSSSAQFKEEAFNQNYDTEGDTTSTGEKMWSFKEFSHGVIHKDSTLKIGSLFAGSMVFVGSQQIYNRQAWKLPVVYGGLGATLGMGFHYRNQYRSSLDAFNAAYSIDPNTSLKIDTHARDMSTYMFVGAGVIYWASLMDGVTNYHKELGKQPGKATLYSLLVPGLGQCYNGEYWKVPVYWGFLIGSFHYYSIYKNNYLKYKKIYTEATLHADTYTGPINADKAKYYRDLFRRTRDYSVVAIAASYLLQIIDANVFAYMQDFDVSDEITMRVAPTVLTPGNEYAFTAPSFQTNAYGISFGFTF